MPATPPPEIGGILSRIPDSALPPAQSERAFRQPDRQERSSRRTRRRIARVALHCCIQILSKRILLSLFPIALRQQRKTEQLAHHICLQVIVFTRISKVNAAKTA